MAKVPKFKSLAETAEFWDAHNFEDYLSPLPNTPQPAAAKPGK